jgi:hypothetical protein
MTCWRRNGSRSRLSRSAIAFVRQPQGNGCIERFFRALKEQLLWVKDFTTLENLSEPLEEFPEVYNDYWILEGSGFNPRGRPVRGCLLSRLLHVNDQKAAHEIWRGI